MHKLPAKAGNIALRGQAALQLAASGAKRPPRFTINAYNGGVIRPDRPYLDAPLIIELAGVSSPPRIAAILDHDERQVVGQTETVRIGRERIDMEGIVTGPWERPGTPAETVVTHASNGMVWPVSLGAFVEQMEFLPAGTEAQVNGSAVRGPLYVARRTRLRHISFLSDGADQTASASIAARAAGDCTMNFHEWLKGLGFEDPAAIPDAQRETLQARFDEQQRAAAAAAKPKPAQQSSNAATVNAGGNGEQRRPQRRVSHDDPLAIPKARRERREGILALMRQFGDEYPEALEEIEEHGNTALEDESWSVRDLENLLLRECTRFQRIDNRQRSERVERVPDQQIIEAALCLASGLRSQTLEKFFDARTLETAASRWRSGLTINQVLMLAARANGASVESHRDLSGMLHGAFQREDVPRRLSAGGPSTIDVSGILSNVANKFLLDGFNYVPQEWRRIARIRTVNDFKQISTYRLVGNGTFEKVGSTGELKHGSLGELAYNNKADTYGIVLGLSRQDLINDDLGALTGAANELGLGAGGSLNDVFWAEFLGNAAFFTSARGNYDEGAETALSLAALELAELLFMTQKKPNGKPLGVRPKILLVPPELYRTALALVRSTLVVATGDTDAVLPNANTFVGAFDPVMVEQLSNSTFSGYSTKAWYLLADPMAVATMEICFVGGKQTPTVEQASADFHQLGIQMRGFLDFGCAKQEYRGGVKMKGEA